MKWGLLRFPSVSVTGVEQMLMWAQHQADSFHHQECGRSLFFSYCSLKSDELIYYTQTG